MDDLVIFLNFLVNTWNVNVARACIKILGFLSNFRALMNTPESQIDKFVKSTHSSNSAHAANARILILSGAIILLKSIQFECEDRRKCNALPNGVQLAAVNTWTTHAEKLRNGLSLNGPEFISDCRTLYSLFEKYLETTGHGSNLVIKYKTTQNGYQLY